MKKNRDRLPAPIEKYVDTLRKLDQELQDAMARSSKTFWGAIAVKRPIDDSDGK